MPRKEWEHCRKVEARVAYNALMKCYPLTLENLDGEQWKWIPDYEGLYQESTFGRTKSFKYKTPRILKPAVNKGGYLVVQLMKAAKLKCVPVHRLVALTFVPNPNNLPQVDHISGMKFDNSVGNLRWVTPSMNMQAAHNLDLVKTSQGEAHYQAKLTKAQVVYVRNNPKALTIGQLSAELNVSESTITNVQLGKSYKNEGGIVRGKMDKHKLSLELRQQICFEYKKGVRGHGFKALAKKYGVNEVTILNIIRGK